jgi:putative ABC transport system permease protein
MHPPKKALAFLRWFCREDYLEEIEGDLTEVFKKQHESSPFIAKWKFAWSVVKYFRPEFMKSLKNYQSNPFDMYNHYVKISIRNLWKNKSYSLLNILGLTAGTVSCLYILLYVQEQYSFDDHHKNAERIFRVITDISTNEKTDRMATISTAILPFIQEDFPEVEEAARVLYRADVNDHLFRVGDKSMYVTEGYYADSTFFNVFTYRFIQGSIRHCLDKPHSMVISSVVAAKLFGEGEAVNQTITMSDNFGTNEYTITGVFDYNYGRSHIRPNFIVNIYSGRFGGFIRKAREWAWDNNAYGYVKLRPGTDAKEFEVKVTNYVSERAKQRLAELGYTKVMHLQPIQEIHVHSNLSSEISKNSNANFLLILIIVSAFIQLIACINFMNLSTARSASRAKEIGIRKSAGAGKTAILWQFLNESILITVISIALALPVLYLLLPYFNIISQYTLSADIFSNPIIWQIVIALIIITGLFAGSYPAFYLSSFKAIEVLKGNFHHRLSAVNLRKGLVVFQFMISVGLIVSVMIIRNQVRFMQDKELGFNKEQKLVIPFRSRDAIRTRIEPFLNAITKLAAVKNATAARNYPGSKIGVDIDLYKTGQTMNDAKLIFADQVDENYFETMEIPLLAGRGFTKADTLGQIIINEAAARVLGISISEAPGENLHTGPAGEASTYPIIGVIKDFNFSSLHEEIKPLFFHYHPGNPNIIVSFQSNDYSTLLANLETAWKQINPQEPFAYFFVDESIQKQYETENTLLRLINSFTILAIFICCLGLFGLAAFKAEQRVKEIGIRKILGATTTSLVALLSKDFLWLVLIACVIITPIAGWAMSRWLQDYAYRISISWWFFVFPATAALLIALVAISFQSIKAAMANPVKNLRAE